MTKLRMKAPFRLLLMLILLVACFSLFGTVAAAEDAVQVTAPVISPESGTVFSRSLIVSITCETEGAEIHYTIDGSDPTAESPVYYGAFYIDSTRTIKAVAMCDGMADSEIVTAEYKKQSSGGGGGSGSGGGGYSAGSGLIGGIKEKMPRFNGEKMPWDEIAIQIGLLERGSEADISLNGLTDVPIEVMQAIADVDAKVNFKVDVAKDWYIDGADIVTPMAADLSVTEPDIEVELSNGIVGARLRIGGTNHPTKLSIRFDKEYAGSFANLYKVEDGTLTFVDCVKLDEKGNAKLLELSEKGDYIVLMGQYSMLLHDVNNDGDIDTEDVMALLYNIVQLMPAENPDMCDVTENGTVNAYDVAALIAFLSAIGL